MRQPQLPPAADKSVKPNATPVVVKTVGGAKRVERMNDLPSDLSRVVRAVADGKVSLKQLKDANLTEATIKRITERAQALKQAAPTTRQRSVGVRCAFRFA